MKAALVYNTKNEPRILLSEFNWAEKELLKHSPDLIAITTGSGEDGGLEDISFAIKNDPRCPMCEEVLGDVGTDTTDEVLWCNKCGEEIVL